MPDRRHIETVLTMLAFGLLPVAALADVQQAPKPACAAAQQFLPGGDGCLGPGFNTPAGDDASTPLGWSALDSKEARRRAEALLAAAPPACVLNADALLDALARNVPVPLPRLAETPACMLWRQTLRQSAPPPATAGAVTPGG